jgi:predicted PurR-regulated permease PerM
MTGRWTWRGNQEREAARHRIAGQVTAQDGASGADVRASGGREDDDEDPAPGHEDAHRGAAARSAAGRTAASSDQDQRSRPAGRLKMTAGSIWQRGQAAAARSAADQPETPPPPQTPVRTEPAAGTGPRSPAPPDAQVPRLLQQAAAWSWRILLVGLLIYLAFKAADALRLVILPLIAALLLSALLQPLTSRLRRLGLPSLAATWCTILVAIIVLAGLGTLAADRVSADYPKLAAEVKHTANEVRAYLAGAPFHLNGAKLQDLVSKIGPYLAAHKTLVAGTVLTGGRYFIELGTGLVLMLFITFFLLKDGRRIFAWLISGMSPDARGRAHNAGFAAWQALVNYIRGTTAVAAIHAVFIGLALWLLGVPLLVPLIILVFLAAYVPLVGILVVGALAILITLATKSWIAAIILLAVFVVENQIEGHLLQPLVVGRLVRLHPLAIIMVLAVGAIIAGIPGAIVAVPTAAVVFYAWPHLRREPGPSPPGGK